MIRESSTGSQPSASGGATGYEGQAEVEILLPSDVPVTDGDGENPWPTEIEGPTGRRYVTHFAYDQGNGRQKVHASSKSGRSG